MILNSRHIAISPIHTDEDFVSEKRIADAMFGKVLDVASDCLFVKKNDVVVLTRMERVLKLDEPTMFFYEMDIKAKLTPEEIEHYLPGYK